eukprot:3163190-Lingulodinium_polyedra.AAC.1
MCGGRSRAAGVLPANTTVYSRRHARSFPGGLCHRGGGGVPGQHPGLCPAVARVVRRLRRGGAGRSPSSN